MCRKRTVQIAAALCALAADCGRCRHGAEPGQDEREERGHPGCRRRLVRVVEEPSEDARSLTISTRSARAGKPSGSTRKAYAGGIDGTMLAYQVHPRPGLGQLRPEAARPRDETAKRLPSGINTTRWECCATELGQLADVQPRTRFRSGQATHPAPEPRDRRAARPRCESGQEGALRAAQLNGTYAVWSRCDPYPQCRIFRYDIGVRLGDGSCRSRLGRSRTRPRSTSSGPSTTRSASRGAATRSSS